MRSPTTRQMSCWEAYLRLLDLELVPCLQGVWALHSQLPPPGRGGGGRLPVAPTSTTRGRRAAPTSTGSRHTHVSDCPQSPVIEGDYLLLSPSPPGGDYLLLPPPSPRGDYLQLPLPPPEGDHLLLLPPLPEGDYLLLLVCHTTVRLSAASVATGSMFTATPAFAGGASLGAISISAYSIATDSLSTASGATGGGPGSAVSISTNSLAVVSIASARIAPAGEASQATVSTSADSIYFLRIAGYTPAR
ncbi:UNVERIFIED_CONTAM: hypothetical protein FKN15_053895 [Acipenser sinensis]